MHLHPGQPLVARPVVTPLADPVAATDPASKGYVDALITEAGTLPYTELIGDGVSTDIVVTHGHGTRDVDLVVYDAAAPFTNRLVDFDRTDADTVTLHFSTPPATDSRRVVIWRSAAAARPIVTTAAGGVLGATETVDFASEPTERWLVGTLDDDLALTVDNPVAGSRLVLLATQDATGGRTLTVNATGVAIPSAAGALAVVVIRWVDDVTFKAESAGVESDPELDALKAVWPVEIGVALSDETTPLTTGTKVTIRAPYAFTLTGVRASVTTAPTGANLIVDVNEEGASLLSTKLSIDAGEKTSTTAAAPAVISDAAIADDAELTFDIDQIGSTIAGTGAKVWLYGTRALP